MPVIYDEVFCGLWRLGVESTRELLGEDPDVSCYAKLLTGGLVPMAATVATERVFDAFSGAKVVPHPFFLRFTAYLLWVSMPRRTHARSSVSCLFFAFTFRVSL